MKDLIKLKEEFGFKYEKFLTGCDALEEIGDWFVEEKGEMDAFLVGDLISILIKLISIDSHFDLKEAEAFNDLFGFDYSADELNEIYNNCKENIDKLVESGVGDGFLIVKRMNEKLALAYKELVLLASKMIMLSDFAISEREEALIESIKEWA